MPRRARSSRAISSIACRLPPWLVTMTSLARPARRTRLADLGPGADHGCRRQRQRAGKLRCSSDWPSFCTGRKVTGSSAGRIAAHPFQIGLGDEAVDAERQVRPVLLDRGDRQHRDPARGVRADKSCHVISSQSRFGSMGTSLAKGGCRMRRHGRLGKTPPVPYFAVHTWSHFLSENRCPLFRKMLLTPGPQE